MNGERFIVVVAEPGDDIPVDTLRAFITNGKQGVNYHRDVCIIRFMHFNHKRIFNGR